MLKKTIIRFQKTIFVIFLVLIGVTLAYILYTERLTLRQINAILLKCDGTLTIPDFRNLAEKWQPVEDSYETDYIFSAYHHQVDSVETVRIIGSIYQAAERKKIYCQLWYNTLGLSRQITSATVEVLQEGSDLRYRTSLFYCNLPDFNIPVAVSLTSQPCQIPKNLLPVRSTTPVAEERSKKKFAVCVPPLHRQYNQTRELIQWIELNRILGADYFVFYNFSTSRQVDLILQFYEKKGLVKVIDWNVTNLLKESKQAMHYHGQHAAMNDCLMKMKSISEFSVNCDLDEILMPHSKCSTWNDIIEQMPNHGGYMFLNSFFCLNWENTKMDFPRRHIAEKYNIWPLLKFRRETRVFAAKERSKYFSRTKLTEIVGTHEVFKMKKGHQVHTVPSGFGLLHHYRDDIPYEEGTVVEEPVCKLIPNYTTVDETAYVKYRDKLIDRVLEIYSEIYPLH